MFNVLFALIWVVADKTISHYRYSEEFWVLGINDIYIRQCIFIAGASILTLYILMLADAGHVSIALQEALRQKIWELSLCLGYFGTLTCRRSNQAVTSDGCNIMHWKRTSIRFVCLPDNRLVSFGFRILKFVARERQVGFWYAHAKCIRVAKSGRSLSFFFFRKHRAVLFEWVVCGIWSYWWWKGYKIFSTRAHCLHLLPILLQK